MVVDPCARQNPLTRAGLTQGRRKRAELGRRHFLPDERDLADLVLFGQRFAKHVQFYGSKNNKDGNWTTFFESDITASLAALTKLPVDAFRDVQLDLENWLKAKEARPPAQLSAHMKLTFHLPLALFEITAGHHGNLPDGHPFGTEIVRLANRDLYTPLEGLVSWYKGATTVSGPGTEIFADTALNPADYNLDGAPADERLRLQSEIATAVLGRPEFSAAVVSELIMAAMPHSSWATLYGTTAADPSPYVDAQAAPNRVYEQVYDALSYNLQSRAIEQLYHGLERIRTDAAVHLKNSLDDFGAHAPQYGLWLAFLQLFEHAKGELNNFTARHLDFYFKEILRLHNRAAVPDQAHLLFELTKLKKVHQLTAGTLFRAGKDTLGRPVSYGTNNDIVINRGTVDQLRGIKMVAGKSGAFDTLLPKAADVVNSRDGLGEVDLAEDDPSFAPFGPTSAPSGRVGFAIADGKLFLREGIRTITLRGELNLPISDTNIIPRWRIRFTGDDGWFELTGDSQIETRATIPKVLEIIVVLSPDDPPVVPLDADLHGTEHDASMPMMEVMFDFDQATTARAFAVLHDLKFNRLSLQTKTKGLKNLMVVADGAVVDVAKPFAPFGTRPRGGAPLHIGSSEIFSKSIKSWNLLIDWEEDYSSTSHFRKIDGSFYNPTEWVLSAGQWLPAEKVDLQLGKSNVTVDMAGGSLIDGKTDQTIENPPLTAKTRNGFVRMHLPADFGHTAYVAEYTRALIALANSEPLSKNDSYRYYDSDPSSTVSDVPKVPYTPVLSRIEAEYTTTCDAVATFIHLHPFGLSAANTEGRLFPDMPFAGALYIGVADFDDPARLTFLVQVLDGSGDPLIPAPDLEFSYLDGDEWIRLLPQNLDDKTANFTGSGILGLNLPELQNRVHQVMPYGLYWIRIAALKDADALNRLLSIDAQAVAVSFVDAANEPGFLATPLPDGTISKLVVPDTALKKITQPYASFGGRPVEPDATFETRVSERLRHKDRAITMWDYEALVLDAFPTLYRAKCLNTTELKRDQNSVIIADNELAPGAVTMVTVPWTHGQNSRDPLRPYTDQKTLKAVDTFLRKRISPFVRLEVHNPNFEEVHLNFKVRFNPEIGDIAFYTDELNKALVAYLTPWSVEDGGDITFGGKLWKSSIIDFIDEWPHVDFVTDFQMFHKVDIQAAADDWTPVDNEVIETTTARSILVSAAQHEIYEVPGNG